QKDAGKGRSDPMSGNVNDSVQRKKNSADQRGQTEALICSLLQRQNSSDDKRRPNNGKCNRRPPQLGPQPEPIAFRMQSAGIAHRGCAKNGEDGVEIPKADSAPG